MNNLILIIDDDAIVREALKGILAQDIYRLEMETNGRRGLEKAMTLSPDLILLDVVMPEMDGFEVCRRIRSNPQIAEVPVIMLTSLDDQESFLRGLECGADDFLTKPFHSSELRARVRSIIRLNRFRRLLEGRALIRELTSKIITVQEEERRHIAQELHDELGQSLTSIGIGLNLLLDDLSESQVEAKARILDMESVIQNTIKQMRLLGQELRPPALDMVGLEPALEGHCREFSRRTKLPILFRVETSPPSLSEACNITLYRFLQETLANAARYSGASQVWVTLSLAGQECFLLVRDDGNGFPFSTQGRLETPIKRQDGSSALGLWGLKERLELLEGRLEINTEPQKGATITAWLPIGNIGRNDDQCFDRR
jgi:signal transduction histidine kinase